MPDGLVNALSDRQQFLDLAKYLVEIASKGPSRERELRPARPALVVAEYEAEVDHAGLIRSMDARSLRRGEAIYTRVCANCHGTLGAPGSMPTSPRFATAILKNGDDPFRLYQTLTRGYGMMAPQTWMVPRQKYDVIHYLRETYLKPGRPGGLPPVDPAYLAGLPKGTTFGPDPVNQEPWVAMDYGPSLMNTYEVGGPGPNFAYKGIAIRLDPGPGGVSRGTRWAAFDHDTLRLAAAWGGRGFIDWKGIHFNGQHQVHPRLVGEVAVANPPGPGWADPATGSLRRPAPRRPRRPTLRPPPEGLGPLPGDLPLWRPGHRLLHRGDRRGPGVVRGRGRHRRPRPGRLLPDSGDRAESPGPPGPGRPGGGRRLAGRAGSRRARPRRRLHPPEGARLDGSDPGQGPDGPGSGGPARHPRPVLVRPPIPEAADRGRPPALAGGADDCRAARQGRRAVRGRHVHPAGAEPLERPGQADRVRLLPRGRSGRGLHLGRRRLADLGVRRAVPDLAADRLGALPAARPEAPGRRDLRLLPRPDRPPPRPQRRRRGRLLRVIQQRPSGDRALPRVRDGTPDGPRGELLLRQERPARPARAGPASWDAPEGGQGWGLDRDPGHRLPGRQRGLPEPRRHLLRDRPGGVLDPQEPDQPRRARGLLREPLGLHRRDRPLRLGHEAAALLAHQRVRPLPRRAHLGPRGASGARWRGRSWTSRTGWAGST